MTTVAAEVQYPAHRWWGRFHDLQGTPWEAEDVRNLKDEIDAPGHWPVIDYLVAAYQNPLINSREDVLEAAIRACGELWPHRWSSADLLRVVDGYSQSYKSWEDALQEYCDEHWPGLRAEWLKDGLKAVDDLVQGESDIWVRTEDGAVHVFNRPA